MSSRATWIRISGSMLIVFGFALPHANSFDLIVAQANNLVQFTEQSFIQNVFGNRRTYSAARKHTEDALAVQIAFVENAAELSEAQTAKLKLAGLGDIHRFFSEYERVKRGMTFGGIPRDEWQAVWRRTQPLSTRFAAGLHGPKSLFSKTISSTLNAEQRHNFEALKKDHAIAIYVDNIRMTLAMLDRKVPLTRRQREAVIALLVNETEPPDFYGQSNMRFYVVLGQMGRLPGEELKKLFSDKEWRVVDGMLRQAKQIEQTLKLQRAALDQ